MWQQLIVGVLVLCAAAYVVRALWPKRRGKAGGSCCDAGTSSTSAKEKAPRSRDRRA
jgi:hypothetical protein